MISRKNLSLLALILTTSMALSACGGSSGSEGSDTNTSSQANNSEVTVDTPDTTQPVANNGQDSNDSTAPDNQSSPVDNSSGEADQSGNNDSGDSGSGDNNTGEDTSGNNDTNQDGSSGDSGSNGSQEPSGNDQSSQDWPEWSATAVYNTGDRVTYNDVVYEAGWWNQGSNPEDSGEWGVWQPVTSDTSNDTGNTSDEGSSDVTEPPVETDPPAETLPGPSTDKVIGSYFVEWGVYGRDYHVNDIPADKLTHVLYGFLPICGPNDSLQTANPSGYSVLVQQCSGKPDYSVVIHDKYAALEKSYPGDQWDDPIKGNFGQFIKLKQTYPHLKVIPSIGGWTLSDPFFSMASNPANRAVFVNSVKEFLTTYNFFDGVDIDWEYPGGEGANTTLGSSADYQAYADLMHDLRAMLDQLEPVLNKQLELTSAVGVGPSKIASVNYAEAQQYMDYVFMMSYDFYGAWNTELGHQTGLYENPAISLHAGFNIHDGVNNLISAGVPANKLVVGVAMYGRGWKGVNGQPDDPFAGQGTGSPIAGSWEDGVLDYKDIEQNFMGGATGQGINGYSYYYDEIAQAPYLWNYSSGSLITFDDQRSTTAKTGYVMSHNLAGVFSWEIDADNGVIINAMHDGMTQGN